jgi:hypothetical protein
MDDRDAGMPRWVKISIAITAVIVVALVVLLLVDNGHGPERHTQSHGLNRTAAVSTDMTL